MNKDVLTIESIMEQIKPIAEKYQVEEIYLFGSYARGEAGEDSDLDFLIYGGEDFNLTFIFDLSEELREIFNKKVDAFEIREVNKDSEFYRAVMKERMLVV